MNNITGLTLFNLVSYAGVDKAVNMQYLTVESTPDPVYFDGYILRNMAKLEDLEILNYGSFRSIQRLNEISTLKILDFTFHDMNIITELKRLSGLNKTILKLEYLEEAEDEEIDSFAEELESVGVKNIFFKNLYKDIVIEEPIKIGKQKTFTFDEINPYFNKYMLNRNSKHYNQDFELYAKSSNVIIDNDKKTVTIKSEETDEEGLQTVDVMYVYYIDRRYPDYEFKISYTLAEDGVFDEETPKYTLGDVNNDGVKNITDSTLILKYMKGMIEFDENQILAGDLNKDGSVNITDYTIYVKFLKGMIEI